MSTPELAPRSPFPGIVAVWVAGLLAASAIGLFVGVEARPQWLCVALGGCLILTFGIQVAYGRPNGFIRRVGLSMLGALMVMGVVSVGFGLAEMMTAV
ncbi:hypothetical protein GCM10009860_20690 [Microbacterium mitrae]|uniref:Uncharacterized protein n=1 Tax=Microbacterium mitrae TaxID=664640 RepID=A0A5C8HLW3_9MICO|nr:hypothetical protein [Microbacterium mitrae]TXK04427.1 hypothetical protein FVP60_06915 [Microbacterium mitrae]